jgi:predicted amidohydrolase
MLWDRLRGADIIIVPAQWGKLRGHHFTTLLSALAVANQCYVVACDSANSDCSNHQGIHTPDAQCLKTPNQNSVASFDYQAIKTMRRYITTGI